MITISDFGTRSVGGHQYGTSPKVFAAGLRKLADAIEAKQITVVGSDEDMHSCLTITSRMGVNDFATTTLTIVLTERVSDDMPKFGAKE